MNRPLLAFAGLIAAGATAAGVYVAVPGGGEEEVVQQVATATPGQNSASPSPGPVTSPPTVEATPVPSPTVAPDGWLVYSDPDDLIAVQYPPTWFRIDGSFFSFDPVPYGARGYLPPEVLKVDAGYYEATGSSSCGPALSVDPRTGVATPEEGATATTLGGVVAWQIVRVQGDPAIEDTLTRIQGINTVYKSYCVGLTGYFTQQDPDVETFLKIAATFQFKF